jgi:hypothetical protein
VRLCEISDLVFVYTRKLCIRWSLNNYLLKIIFVRHNALPCGAPIEKKLWGSKRDLQETTRFIKTIQIVVWGLMLKTQKKKNYQCECVQQQPFWLSDMRKIYISDICKTHDQISHTSDISQDNWPMDISFSKSKSVVKQ